MLSLDQILNSARDGDIPLDRKKQILAEYLQCEILDSLTKNKLSDKLHFIGGTALRIFYHLPRFSENLDFDNFGLSEKQFSSLIKSTFEDLKFKGFEIDQTIKFKMAYHCYFRFKNLLYKYKISFLSQEKILIKIDLTPQDYKILPDLLFFNKYGILEQIKVNPLDILFSQKALAVLGRKTNKGRDFFDLIFLKGLSKPNFDYLKKKADIKNMTELKGELLKKCKKLNFSLLARDVAPYLFNARDAEKIKKFPDYIKSWQFSS